jgi:pSer/pThr/pTyr-binding forkhead associated (FHA) protein
VIYTTTTENGESQFTIKDTNSTNHTYLNDVQISPSESIPLVDGDKLKFGDEEFVFKVENV